MSGKLHAMLSTDALHSAKIDGLTLEAEAVYYRLHMATDKFGTMPGALRDVMSRAFPSRNVDPDTVARALGELVDARLVERWCEVGGEHDGEWLHLTRFDDHCSSDYKRKRTRRTPVPPSQRDDSGPVPAPFPSGSGPVPGTGAEASIPSHSRPVPVPSRGEGRVDSLPASGIGPAIAAALDPAQLHDDGYASRYHTMLERSRQQATVIDELLQQRAQLGSQEAEADPASGGGEPSDANRRALPAAAHPVPRPRYDPLADAAATARQQSNPGAALPTTEREAAATNDREAVA